MLIFIHLYKFQDYMKKILILLIFSFSLLTNAQDQKIVKSFDSMVNVRNGWKDYKLIKRTELDTYRKELVSAADSFQSKIETLDNSINQNNKEIGDLKALNNDLNAQLKALKNSKDEMNLLGLKMSKSNYLILVWSIILVLLLALGFIFIKYRNRNIITQELKENLANTTKEFEEYKHRAIEKQQKLGRELLDAQKAAQSRNNKK